MCWQYRGRHLLFQVSRILLDPESRDVKGWCSTQRPSSILVCVGGTAKRDQLTIHSLTRLLVYEHHITKNTSVRCRRLMGVTRRLDAARFIRFTRLPGGSGVLRRLCIIFLPAAVALRFAAFVTFLPATTSPAICAPVVSARFPKTTAPLLIRGATVRRRPMNKLPNPCPLWSAGKVGQCPIHLPRIVVVVIHLNLTFWADSIIIRSSSSSSTFLPGSPGRSHILPVLQLGIEHLKYRNSKPQELVTVLGDSRQG